MTTSGKLGEGHGDPSGVPPDRLGGQGERRPGKQIHGFLRQVPDPHFGTGQVGHDGQPLPCFLGGLPEAGDDLSVRIKGAMGKIEAGHIHAGPDHLFHDLRGFGGRPDGADDLGFVGG